MKGHYAHTHHTTHSPMEQFIEPMWRQGGCVKHQTVSDKVQDRTMDLWRTQHYPLHHRASLFGKYKAKKRYLSHISCLLTCGHYPSYFLQWYFSHMRVWIWKVFFDSWEELHNIQSSEQQKHSADLSMSQISWLCSSEASLAVSPRLCGKAWGTVWLQWGVRSCAWWLRCRGSSTPFSHTAWTLHTANFSRTHLSFTLHYLHLLLPASSSLTTVL